VKPIFLRFAIPGGSTLSAIAQERRSLPALGQSGAN
jgi:hypothetical protein